MSTAPHPPRDNRPPFVPRAEFKKEVEHVIKPAIKEAVKETVHKSVVGFSFSIRHYIMFALFTAFAILTAVGLYYIFSEMQAFYDDPSIDIRTVVDKSILGMILFVFGSVACFLMNFGLLIYIAGKI